MSQARIFDTSTTISIIKRIWSWFNKRTQRINYACKNSHTFQLAKGFSTRSKTSIKYSFLGRITEIGQDYSAVLENSRTILFLFNSYNNIKKKINNMLDTSSTAVLTKDVKRDVFLAPVKMISICLVAALSFNLLISIILNKPITLWGGLIRGLFLVAAVIGLFCKADWQTIKKNSVFLRKVVHQQVQKNHI